MDRYVTVTVAPGTLSSGAFLTKLTRGYIDPTKVGLAIEGEYNWHKQLVA